MKLFRKFAALILSLCLALAMSSIAFAEEGEFGGLHYSDDTSVVITKVFRLESSGSSTAETFTLRQIGDGVVKDGEAAYAPALGTITGAAFAEGAATADGAEGQIIVNLPSYERVGIYEYTLREVPGTTAGVTYYGNDIKLVVTVINDESIGRLRVAAVHTESTGEEKSDRFPNIYSAGTLNITKTVTGNLGDKTRYFKFTVTLNGEDGKTYAESYAVTGGSYEGNPVSIMIGESSTFYLKHDETLSIANLPYGVSYTVEEDTPDDYTVSKTNESGVIQTASVTAAFTNTKGGTPDTGITLDSLPYVAILALTVIVSLVFFVKRRSGKD